MLGAAAALFFTAGQAAADGLPSRGKTRAADERHPCSVSGYAGVSSDAVSRGISQSAGDFAVLGGVELTCGRFYAGVDGTSVNIDPGLDATALAELSFGFRPKTGPVTWDLGFIYHAHNSEQSVLDFYELKVGASAEVWRGGTFEVTALYTPDSGGNAAFLLNALGERVWTVEGSFSQVLPKVGILTPTLSAAIGSVNYSEDEDSYTYWNFGLTLDLREHWSFDIRYSDTSGIVGGCPIVQGNDVCDGRTVATLKYTF
jgi:uncharacterized protein (TIGR02001 family)